jgi:hypothetical protein
MSYGVFSFLVLLLVSTTQASPVLDFFYLFFPSRTLYGNYPVLCDAVDGMSVASGISAVAMALNKAFRETPCFRLAGLGGVFFEVRIHFGLMPILESNALVQFDFPITTFSVGI